MVGVSTFVSEEMVQFSCSVLLYKTMATTGTKITPEAGTVYNRNKAIKTSIGFSVRQMSSCTCTCIEGSCTYTVQDDLSVRVIFGKICL